MRVYVATLNDWRSRLARLEVQFEVSEASGEIDWHLRIKVRILRFLLARYSEPVWEPSWPLGTGDLCGAITDQTDETSPFGWDEGDAAAIVRAAVGAPEGSGNLSELTWSEVCYCLLPWDQPCQPPGSEALENRPRPREVLADRSRSIQVLNMRPRRRWFNWFT